MVDSSTDGAALESSTAGVVLERAMEGAAVETAGAPVEEEVETAGGGAVAAVPEDEV
jgi:hypothetical protein